MNRLWRPTRRKLVGGLASSVLASPSVAQIVQFSGRPTGGPPDITLQDIDGGNSYYADNGFTNAVTAGFDSADFFPISLFLNPCNGQTQADTWIDLNLNTMISAQANEIQYTALRDNGIFAVFQDNELAQIMAENGGQPPGSECIGLNAFDEPNTLAQAIGALQTRANAIQDNRLWYENFTWNQLAFFDVEGTQMDDLYNLPVTTPNATTRKLNLPSVDIYWMAGNNGGDGGAFSSQTLYALGAPLTTDQRRRGARYGDMLDWMRLGNPILGHPSYFAAVGTRAPTSVFIETGGPYEEDVTIADYITPKELISAVWSTLIHGARHIQYFTHCFAGPGDGANFISNPAFYQSTPYPSEPGVSMYNTLKAVNALVKSLAGVLNSPFALNYASVSPAGWRFGDAPFSTFNGTGIDLMTKKHTRGAGADDKFYLFASPRYSPATVNQTATFTIADTSATQITVIGESRTIAASGGVFQDTFADGLTVHIYRVD